MTTRLMDILYAPGKCATLTAQDWDRLIPQARATGLLATLGSAIEDQGQLDALPPEVSRHLQSAICVWRRQQAGLIYELKWLRSAFARVGEPVILLKGAAYAAAQLPAARGRLLSDIDLLVRAECLPEAERVLNELGWESDLEDGYNDRYYRKWMHEIPPLVHENRESTLDVHHTLVPPTTRSKLDASLLFTELREVSDGICVLSPRDMVLHSAVHLFSEGDFSHGPRDLMDMDLLLRHFAATEPDYWSALIDRAFALDLARPLYYALRYARRYLQTPVPESAQAAIARAAPVAPPLMDFFFHRALLPGTAGIEVPFEQLALFCLYVRSHAVRMPWYLLVPHLARKAWASRFPA